MKILHALIFLLGILFCKKLDAQLDTSIAWINLEGSIYLAIPATNADEIVKAAESLKTYNKWYWQSLEKDKMQDSIIATYADITGVQAISLKDLRELAANKKAIDAQTIVDLKQKAKDEKKKGRKQGAVAGTVVGLGLGVLLHVLIMSLI